MKLGEATTATSTEKAAAYVFQRVLTEDRARMQFPCCRKYGNNIDVYTTGAQEEAVGTLKSFLLYVLAVCFVLGTHRTL
jgi:hypothetical protein